MLEANENYVSNLNWDAKYSTETKCRFPILVSLTWRVRHLLYFHNNSWGHRGRLQGSFVFFCEWRHSKEGREYLMMRRRDSNIQLDKRWRVTPFETLCTWKREEFCFNLFRCLIFFTSIAPFSVVLKLHCARGGKLITCEVFLVKR